MYEQIVYKHSGQYYEIQKKELLEKGWEIITDDEEKTIFHKSLIN